MDESGRPARPWRRLTALLAVAFVLVGAVAGTIRWLVGSTGGLRLVVRAVDVLTPAHVRAETPRGALATGFGFGRLQIAVGRTEVDILDLSADLADVGLAPLRFSFAALSARRVQVRVRPDAATGEAPPASIASPVAVDILRLEVGEFLLRVGPDDAATDLSARAIAGRIALDADGYRIAEGAFEFGRADAPLAATVRGTLGGAAPFALQAEGTLRSQLHDKPLQATLAAHGSLTRFELTASVTGGGAEGALAATVASFESPALRALHLDVRGIDPRLWSPTAPSADLALRADLQPTPGPDFGLAGEIGLANMAPGPVDTGRIPLRTALGRLWWQGEALHVRQVDAHLTHGRAEGDGSLRWGDAVAWEIDARLREVDLAALHTRLRPLRVNGRIAVQRARKVHMLQAELRHQGQFAAQLALDLAVDSERIALRRAALTLGEGMLSAAGEINLTGARAVRLRGEAQALDLARLIEGMAVRLGGEFTLEGTLPPQPSGQLTLRLADSVAFGRPLAGRVAASLSSEQRLAVDADLALRSARLRAAGALDGSDGAITFDVQAPALQELALPLRGALSLQGTLHGHWRAPALSARLLASSLRSDRHVLQALTAALEYGGGQDGAVSVQADANGYRWFGAAPLVVPSARLTVQGRASAHEIRLEASDDRGHVVRIAAAGGLQGDGWAGQLTLARVEGALSLALTDTAPLQIGRAGLRVGPARLSVFGASVEDLTVAVGAGRLQTRGRFAGFRPGDLIARRSTSLLPRAPREPLALRGAWDVTLAQRADGELTIERESGDLYAAAGEQAAMGVTELRLAARLQANALSATLDLRGTQLGRLQASAQARVERDAQAGWRLARQQPWQLMVEADLPSIAWMNALASERIHANVRIGGALAGRVRIEGTPAQPLASGRVSGADLRVAWIEQGVRLENGTLAARIEGDSVILEDLRFVGPPRVQPRDARVAQKLAKLPSGFVAASGRATLPELTGWIQVQAQHLPLLQRPDRWVVATGGANIEFSPRRVQVNGAAAVDAAFVDFSRPDLPTLSADVMVLQTADSPRAREPRVALGFDLGLDAGTAFYLRGAGLQTRVAGAVRLRSEGRGIVRATGALAAEDGVYEGYGQKLKIVRGRVNFQGPPENPGLDILALRTDLPPEAGEIGVSITRTAANPLIRLHADPPRPDAQALSWLVLGRPADQSGQDNAALARAAIGLLAGSGEGLPTTLARQLGIDEIALRSGTVGGSNSLLPRSGVAGNLRGATVGGAGSAQAEIIAIGKRVNEALTIRYEQALTGAAGVVQLSYQLTRRLSLIARAGTENALELVYSFAFD